MKFIRFKRAAGQKLGPARTAEVVQETSDAAIDARRAGRRQAVKFVANHPKSKALLARPMQPDPVLAPLNGTRTHPLSEHALKALGEIEHDPKPCQEINPGVGNRLRREMLAEVVLKESPYRTVEGKINFLQITEAGRARLAAEREKKPKSAK